VLSLDIPVRSYAAPPGKTAQPLPNAQVVHGMSRDLLVTLSMNFNNSSTHHGGLIDNLRKNNLIRSQRVHAAMSYVDRADFAPTNPYEDKPQKIGMGATISTPHMHAISLDALSAFLNPGATALDVGSGSGYVAACMALMVDTSDRSGRVVGIDHTEALVAQSIENVRKSHTMLLDRGILTLRVGNACAQPPASELDLYDCIHVGAAVDHIPEELVSRLKMGGAILVPVCKPGSAEQDLVLAIKRPADVRDAAVATAEARQDYFVGQTPKRADGAETSPASEVATEPAARPDYMLQQQVIMTCIYSPLSLVPPENEESEDGLFTYMSLKEEADALKQQIDSLSKQLRDWQVDFLKTRGRKPTQAEFSQVPAFGQYQTLVKEMRSVTKKALAASAKVKDA